MAQLANEFAVVFSIQLQRLLLLRSRKNFEQRSTIRPATSAVKNVSTIVESSINKYWQKKRLTLMGIDENLN